MFLESRIYEKVPVQRLVYLLRVKKWMKVSWTMLVVGFFQLLWLFTIIGGVIKYYAYFLVPYIVAENPDISAKQAIRLSQDMMKGHKWECFILELSYIGWDILGAFTLGISKVLYSNPYQVAGYCEYYAEIRRVYIEEQKSGYELLNDRYLFEQADRWELMETYGDIILGLEESILEERKISGVRGVMENVFGIVPMYSEDEKRYQENENRKMQMMVFQDAAEGKAYPGRLSSIPEHQKRKKLETMHYLRHYSAASLILMFFLFSMIGWL